jgi:hypothetical protein
MELDLQSLFGLNVHSWFTRRIYNSYEGNTVEEKKGRVRRFSKKFHGSRKKRGGKEGNAIICPPNPCLYSRLRDRFLKAT